MVEEEVGAVVGESGQPHRAGETALAPHFAVPPESFRGDLLKILEKWLPQ